MEIKYKKWTECVKSAVILDWTTTKYVDTFLGLAPWYTLSPNTLNVHTIEMITQSDEQEGVTTIE